MGQAQIAYDVDENPCDFQLQYSTAPSVGVSGLAAVVLGTHEMALFDKAGNKIDSRDWFFELPDPTYPFAPGNDGASILRSLVFPRAEYDPLTGRLWMFYSEAFNVAPESGPDCTPILHIAVDKGVGNFHPNPGLLEGLGEDHWWYYTGNASDMTEGNGGVAFKLNSSSVDPFREPVFPQIPVGSHAPLQDTALLASYGFDERAIVAAMSSRLACTQDGIDAYEQYIYLIPRSNNDFSTNDEWLIDGVRADEGSFVCIQMRDAPLIEDDSVFGYVVQEPYEQYANATFLVSTAGSQPGESQTAIRVKGLFFNDGGTPEDPSDDQWEVRQSLEQDASAPQGWRLFDSDIGDPLLNFYRPTADDYPDAPAFSPTVEGDFFTSAVLTKDASGTPRIFAVHAALADDGTGNPSDRWIVQWYVIDPDLTDFHSAPILSEDWRPTVIARGRIEESQGDCYHPVLGVNDDGLMTIEYTYSSGSDDQEIRRARFNSSYAITSTQSLAPAPTLPDQGFLNSRWALYADLQFDPSAGPGLCNWLWSTHTLVDGDATMATYIRDVWLYRQNQAGLCFQTDLNQSGFTDLIDMMMYTDYYMRGDERADTDYDGYVDAIDMANYLNAYRAATGP